MKLKILKKYLERENALKWLEDYCKRNKIHISSVTEFCFNTKEERYFLFFKSSHQLKHFLCKACSAFPYFEWL